MNGLLIVVGIIFLICVIVGYKQGFIKIVASLAMNAICERCDFKDIPD